MSVNTNINSIVNNRRGGGGIPFKDDLNFLASGRDGLTIPASIGSNAKILPALAQFNPSDAAYLVLNSNVVINEGEIEIHGNQPVITGTYGLITGTGIGQDSYVRIQSTVLIYFRLESQILQFAMSNYSLSNINTFRFVLRQHEGVTKVRAYINGVESSSGEKSCNASRSFTFSRIGYGSGLCNLSYINFSNSEGNIFTMYPNGLGAYEYDVSGNENYATWTGSPNTIYNEEGSTYFFDNGFTIYEKPDQLDEYVPYGADASVITSPLYERVDYMVKEAFSGNVSKHNLAPSMVQFTEDVWDRSNIDIWEDAARLGYYDDTDADTKKRWHISELNQATFKAWLKPAYQEIVFTKFQNNSTENGRTLNSIFAYSNVKTSDDLEKILRYTGYKYAITDLTSEFIVDTTLAKLDWTDVYGGSAVYEIWRSYNGSEKEYISTTGLGAETYSDTTCKQNIHVKYYIRPKVSGVNQAFSCADTIITPWCFKTDQSTLNDVVFKSFTLAEGSGLYPVTIHWGDDSTTELRASQINANVTHSYTGTGQYNIWLTGRVDSIRFIELLEQDHIYGDVTNWVFPYNSGAFHMYKTGLTGDITDHFTWIKGLPNFSVYDAQYLQVTGDVSEWRWAETNVFDIHFEYTLVTGDVTNWDFISETNSGSAKIFLYDTLLTGNISDWIMPEGMNYLYTQGTDFTLDMTNFFIPNKFGQLHISGSGGNILDLKGDVSNLRLPTITPPIGSGTEFKLENGELTGNMNNVLIPDLDTVCELYFKNNNITGMPRGEFKRVSIFDFSVNNCDSSEIDSLLEYIDNYFDTETPIRNCTYSLNGVGMGIPSATGLAAKASIESKYTTAGFTATINVNS